MTPQVRTRKVYPVLPCHPKRIRGSNTRFDPAPPDCFERGYATPLARNIPSIIGPYPTASKAVTSAPGHSDRDD